MSSAVFRYTQTDRQTETLGLQNTNKFAWHAVEMYCIVVTLMF